LDGNPYYAVVERADEPIVAGTPLNAETLNGVIDAILAKLPIESSYHPGCYYRRVGGEPEWINPPMIQDVEYRTSERCDGEAVYTKRIVIDPLPTIGVLVDREITNGSQPYLLDVRATITREDQQRTIIYNPPFVNISGDNKPLVAVGAIMDPVDSEHSRLMLQVRVLGEDAALSRMTIDLKYTLGNVAPVTPDVNALTLTDQATTDQYKLYVSGGELAMEETGAAVSSESSLTLKDQQTGSRFEIYVSNGKLTMGEVEV
jgi:hypothetical protein